MRYDTEYRTLKVADIIPAPYNPREDIIPGSDEYNALKRSIGDHGLVEPLVVNLHNMRCIGGNQRLTIVRDLGWETVTCSVIDQPDELQEKKLSLGLNRIDGRWNETLLGDLLRDDAVLEYETGFSEDEALLYKQLENTYEAPIDDEAELLDQFDSTDTDGYEDDDADDDLYEPLHDEEDVSGDFTLIRIGNYHFKCEMGLYEKLIQSIRDNGIFNERKICEEIKRRLLNNG